MQNLSYENEFDLHENEPVSCTFCFDTGKAQLENDRIFEFFPSTPIGPSYHSRIRSSLREIIEILQL